MPRQRSIAVFMGCPFCSCWCLSSPQSMHLGRLERWSPAPPRRALRPDRPAQAPWGTAASRGWQLARCKDERRAGACGMHSTPHRTDHRSVDRGLIHPRLAAQWCPQMHANTPSAVAGCLLPTGMALKRFEDATPRRQDSRNSGSRMLSSRAAPTSL